MTARRDQGLWCSGVMLLMGGMIYILLRTKLTLINLLLSHAGADTDGLREHASHWNLPEWIIYNLPGGLWSAAYILVIDSMMKGESAAKRLRWTSVMPAIGVGSEALQALGLLPGTADVQDAVCYLVPYLIYTMYVSLKTIKS